MDLSKENLSNKEFWNSINVVLPQYDIDACIKATTENPTWLHVGGGNIFRAFIARINQRLLNQGLTDTGIIVCGTQDYENFERVYKPFDNLSIICDLRPDGNTGYEIIGNITEAIAANYDLQDKINRLNEIARNPSLQIISFTITEKGYALRDADGNLYEAAAKDMENGPSHPLTCMGFIAALLLERFNAGGYPLALVSMDNCSHNGDILKSSVLEIIDAWTSKGFVGESFRDYVKDPSRIAFPWSMIDKITPRPSDEILNKLTGLGIGNLKSVRTTTGVFAAPFVNAEVPEYLVVEDLFPNGRPALEKGGVIITDRDTVDKAERMKVTACLNPLHTSLAIFGCLLGFNKISDEMNDEDLRTLVTRMGYEECLPVVCDPKILNPEAFLKQVLEERFPNPFLPDTPQRIATDTSQKLPIRFGITLNSYMNDQPERLSELKLIPLVIAGWLRYLLAVDDNGNAFEISPDPMAGLFQKELREAGISYGMKESVKGKLSRILSNATVFGTDINKTGLTPVIEQYLDDLIKENGAVRKTLHAAIAN
ncbi:MAG: mannitol dehydrogenase family protein [Saccharofermentans sp.]|nr:mannitol dehydrogenase family protein [Saccharofermentans sp.]